MARRSRRRLNSIGWVVPLLATAMLLPVERLMAHGTGSISGDAPLEHQHEMLEIPASQPVPAVNLILHPDPMRGWNLEIQTSNFRFAPEEMGAASKTTADPNGTISGHAHLYIDGKKITRLYGNWYYISNLPPGSHQIRVSLSTNQHEELIHNGQPIAATLEVNVPADAAPGDHSH